MAGQTIGRCHICGRLLPVHDWFVADGFQHEEYYCDRCGETARGVFQLRLNEPRWRGLYERRQLLIERRCPGRGLFRRRCDARRVAAWLEQIHEAGAALAAAAPADAASSGESWRARRVRSRERPR